MKTKTFLRIVGLLIASAGCLILAVLKSKGTI